MGQFFIAKRRIDDIFRALTRVCENSSWRMTLIASSTPSARNTEKVCFGSAVFAVVGTAVGINHFVQLQEDGKEVD